MRRPRTFITLSIVLVEALGRLGHARTDGEQTPGAAGRSSLTTVLATAISVAALTVSTLTFYYTWWYDNPHLMARISDSDNGLRASELQGSPESYAGNLQIRLELTNVGNRPAALLAVALIFLKSDTPSCETLSDIRLPDSGTGQFTEFSRHSGGLHSEPIQFASFGWDGTGQVVDPGKIVILRPKFHYQFTFHEFGSRRVHACLIFSTMDDAGQLRSTSFRAADVTFESGGEWRDYIVTPLKLM